MNYSPPNDLQQVGSNLEDVNGRDKVTGRALYMSDFFPANVGHIKLLRSPYAHARIISIDISRAVALPGVWGVVTGEDTQILDHTYGMFIRDQPIIAYQKVRYAGEPVVAIAAESEALALAALDLVDVEYEVLPAVTTIAAALAPDAPLLFDTVPHAATLQPPPLNSQWAQEPGANILFHFDYSFGDIDALFASCPHVFEDRFSMGRQSHAALEPHVVVARPTESGGVEIWSNNQDPFLLQDDISRIFGLPLEHVQFHTGLVGGGFGSKSYCKVEPITVLLALKTGREVRLGLTMAESMLTVSDSAAEITIRTGVGADGEFVVREAIVELDSGAYADASPSVAMRIGTRFNGPYKWQGIRTRVRAIRTNTIPAGSFRGFGMGHITWPAESQIDIIADRLAIAPDELRLKNFLASGTSGAPGEKPLDSDLAAGFEAVRNIVGRWPSSNSVKSGIGYAVACKGAGSSHTAGAHIRLFPGGKVELAAGVAEIGQNSRTILTQVAAEVLAISPHDIRVVDIDTQKTPYDSGTHASNGATIAGLAVQKAALALLADLKQRAAKAFGGDAESYTFRDGVICGPERQITLAELAHALPAGKACFEGEAVVQTPGGSQFWMPIWTAAQVEVDDVTGIVRLTRLVQAADVGRAINPQRCVGQIDGAAAQGIGQALFEDIGYRDDLPLAADPLSYRLPRLLDMPGDAETIILEQGRGPGPFGAKGIGESGNLTIPAAIANAIADAVGARVTQLPMTPERVLQAIVDR